ncbi:MAG: hypothetical protein PF450_04550 [Bacteroidales bacterium]|nr:hypothetical protein [Bacteroidales bacterium]
MEQLLDLLALLRPPQSLIGIEGHEMETEKKLCPLCGEGYLTEKVVKNLITHRKVSCENDLHFSTCDGCGSDQADNEQSNKNKDIAVNYRKYVNQILVNEVSGGFMFTIVKYADDVYWHFHFERDPKETGVLLSMSMYTTYVGNLNRIKQMYSDPDEAEIHCRRLNADNPSGGYGVCRIIDVPHSE